VSFDSLVVGTSIKFDNFQWDGGAVKIVDPYKTWPSLKYVERDSFLTNLYGKYSFDVSDIEVTLQNLSPELQKDPRVYNTFQAHTYLTTARARRPKFTRWLNSVLPDHKALHDYIAKLLQDSRADEITVAGDPVSIFNAPNSTAFTSCMTTYNGGHNHSQFKKLMEECPGVAVAYILDKKKGQMKGRVWLHKVVHPVYGPGIFLGRQYGCLTHKQIASALNAKFPDLIFITQGYPKLGQKPAGKTKWRHDGFKNIGYFDTPDDLSNCEYVSFPPDQSKVGQVVDSND
jgi:hypothetical protein